MTTEERLLRLENAFATLSELAARSEDRHTDTDSRLDKLLTLAISADERLTVHDGWINQLGASNARLAEAQANSEAKLAALASAQIQTEEAITGLTRRLDALIERLERNGEAP